MEAKDCAHCGSSFSKRKGTKFCSKQCRGLAEYHRNRDKRLAYSRSWKENNPQMAKERRRREYAASMSTPEGREKNRTKTEEYRRKNPEAAMISSIKSERRRGAKKAVSEVLYKLEFENVTD